MKKIIYSALILMGLTLSSCSDYLDKYPSDAVSTNAKITENIAIALTNACYKPLQSSNLYNMRMWSLDIIGSNSNVGAGGGTDGIETVQAANFTATSDNGFALYVWRSPWVGIAQCNTLLQSVANADINEDIKNRCMGEAYFLRRMKVGTNSVMDRWFGFDSLGRMVLNVDPSTSAFFSADPSTNPNSILA